MYLNDKLQRLNDKLAEIAGQSDTGVSVYTYKDYEHHKKEILHERYLYRFAPGLAWLYDPDSRSDNLFTRAQWGEEYKFVVVLKGSDEEVMYNLAGRFLDEEPEIGLIYIQFDDPS